ncbi:MAG: type I-E CRISPR-associated protein Cas6/Cse3/CasE [Firmicutes bacterium ZCTH02-B6]|nr:MAG: type I-E CRISPR-associated protein Cas6/Cse3/CasE [Firmicutes bacterium ZCTH02-B6]
MFLTLLRLNPSSAAVQRDLRDPHELHRTIMRAFPPVIDPEVEARSYWGVLHRLEFDRRGGRILLYVQSRVAPDWSFLPEGYLAQDGWENPAVKAVDHAYANLKAGRVLRFRLRANPTRKIDTKSGPNGEKRNGRRVPLTGVDAQLAWLRRKAGDHGFEILDASVTATGASELIYSHSTGRTLQSVLFEGRLIVRDPTRFRDALERGIGPGKAYGCGLLSIGPV